MLPDCLRQLTPPELARIAAATWIALSASSLSACSGDASAPESLTFELDGDRVLVAGTIDGDTPDRLEAFIEEHPRATVFSLRAIPGSVNDEANLEAARLLREHGATTLVEADGFVASGGTDFFLAGRERIVESGACIGVHSWADSEGHQGLELDEDDSDHDLFLDYYDEMGIEEAFYWFTLEAAAADGMHWMTLSELEAYALATEFKVVDEEAGDCDDRADLSR